MHSWLLNNSWFGEYLRNYKEGKGISFKAKIVVVTLLWIAMTYSIFFVLNILVVFALPIMLGEGKFMIYASSL
jgi:uncharacterized membrane protein YbaN (DUF454 family)